MNWQGTLTTIAACSGVGGFIDFWIGRGGQTKVRGWLETLWLRLSYVRLNNFGREEARFAIVVLDSVVGATLFSVRRLIAVVITTIFVFLIVWIVMNTEAEKSVWDLVDETFTLGEIFAFLTAVLFFWPALSFTRWFAALVARLCRDSIVINLTVFILAFAVNYGLTALSGPLARSISYYMDLEIGLVESGTRDMSEFFPDIFQMLAIPLKEFLSGSTLDPSEIIRHFNLITSDDELRSEDFSNTLYFFGWILSSLPGIGRLFISIGFIGSFLLRPLRASILKLTRFGGAPHTFAGGFSYGQNSPALLA